MNSDSEFEKYGLLIIVFILSIICDFWIVIC